MKTSVSLLSACLLSIGVSLSALEITADFPVVAAEGRGLPEQKAPEVLQEHLSRIFGREVKVIPATAWKEGASAIILRSDARLDQEEWNIESDGKNLTISGGWPRGLYYGVCEFLEKFGGVRWFTAHETRIPQKTSIMVPDNQPFRRKPAFPLQRRTNVVDTGPAYNNSRAMLKQSSVSAYGKWPSLFISRGFGPGGQGAHNFWVLTKAVPSGMERMLPVDKNGRPQRGVNGFGPNQVCFSNPEFREFAKKEVGKCIAKMENYVHKKGIYREGFLRWIDLSQNDNPSCCQCANCKALYEKYGAISGAQLEFINDIASAFPDYIFQTFAYQLTQKAPKGITARDNVMIQMAYLSSCDLLRPISHPNNEKIRKQYEDWRDIAKHKAIWTYHRLYHMSEAFPWPQCCYWNIAENYRYFYNYGAIKLYQGSEYEEDGFASRAFNDLHNYLECKLMDDPFQDDKILIEEFFQYQYGPAAEEMKAYASYLKKRIDAVPGKVQDTPLKTRGILDAEFFVIVNTLLDRAEAKAGNDKGLLIRIAMERIPVDYAALEMWKLGGSASGRSREEIITRLENNVKHFFARYYPDRKKKIYGRTVAEREKEALGKLEIMRHPLQVPPEFAMYDVIQIPAYGTCDPQDLTDDPDAAFGKAVKLGKVDPQWDHTKYPMLFGIYDNTTRQYIRERIILPNEIPQDEKTYRLYHIVRHTPNGFHKEQFYGHKSWRLNIRYLYKKLWDPIDDGREYDIYISCKMTGPAYVKGSTKENAVYVDKLLAVKRGSQQEKNGHPGQK